jgi:hypothetical protein
LSRHVNSALYINGLSSKIKNKAAHFLPRGIFRKTI